MSKTAWIALFLVPPLAVESLGQIPPGYKIVTIDDDPTFNYTARMNNRGQIVYSVWTDGGNTDAIEIMLYDNGKLTRLTNDNVYDRTPDINDDGTIVWSRATDGPGSPTQIVMWRDGELTQLTHSELDERSPRINKLGHVVWQRRMGDGCRGAKMDVFFYDGRTIRRITTNGETDNLANQTVDINDHDDIVWTEYDFCPQEDWESRVMMYSGGDVTQLSPPDVDSPRHPYMNDSRQVAWTFQSGWGEHGIQIWQDGVVTTLTDWGNVSGLNNRGDIAVFRFYETGHPVGAYEVWLYRDGKFLQITDEPHNRGWENTWNFPTDINERGEMVFFSGRPWYYESIFKYMRLRAFDAEAGATTAKRIDP